MNSIAELLNWVCLHVGPEANAADVAAITKAISIHDDCPAWGDYWQDFLASLPENLFDLI